MLTSQVGKHMNAPSLFYEFTIQRNREYWPDAMEQLPAERLIALVEWIAEEVADSAREDRPVHPLTQPLLSCALWECFKRFRSSEFPPCLIV